MASPNPVIAVSTRSGVVETVHRGRIAVVADERLLWSLGDVRAPFFPRSATKPLQTLAMLSAGLDLDGELLALATASHSGTPERRAGVDEILTGAGLSRADLATTPATPSDESARLAWLAAGRGPEPIAHGCSGKHAAMLRVCARAGWATTGHLDPAHPLQRLITALVAERTGERPSVGVDGCGAPAHTMSARALARGYGRLAGAAAGPERRLADAMRAHPEWASGPGMWEERLHRVVPGSVCKHGARGTAAIGLPDGRGVAIRLDDGSLEPLPAIAVAVLASLGVDAPGLAEVGEVPVLGGGRPVGRVEARLG